MLKGINPILSPELLKILCEMGHSDTIVIADGNFPAMSVGKNAIVLRMDGHGVPEILEAILEVFPLDQYIEKPVSLMELNGPPNFEGRICEKRVYLRPSSKPTINLVSDTPLSAANF